jgi:hypothetical protein
MSKRYPSQEDQRVIYDVMTGLYEDIMAEPGGLYSLHAEAETIHMLRGFDDENFAPGPVEVLSRAALRDAAALHAVKNLSPEDFAS